MPESIWVVLPIFKTTKATPCGWLFSFLGHGMQCLTRTGQFDSESDGGIFNAGVNLGSPTNIQNEKATPCGWLFSFLGHGMQCLTRTGQFNSESDGGIFNAGVNLGS